MPPTRPQLRPTGVRCSGLCCCSRLTLMKLASRPDMPLYKSMIGTGGVGVITALGSLVITLPVGAPIGSFEPGWRALEGVGSRC